MDGFAAVNSVSGEDAEVESSPILYSAMDLACSKAAIRTGSAGNKLMRSFTRNMKLIARPALATKA